MVQVDILLVMAYIPRQREGNVLSKLCKNRTTVGCTPWRGSSQNGSPDSVADASRAHDSCCVHCPSSHPDVVLVRAPRGHSKVLLAMHR